MQVFATDGEAELGIVAPPGPVKVLGRPICRSRRQSDGPRSGPLGLVAGGVEVDRGGRAGGSRHTGERAVGRAVVQTGGGAASAGNGIKVASRTPEIRPADLRIDVLRAAKGTEYARVCCGVTTGPGQARQPSGRNRSACRRRRLLDGQTTQHGPRLGDGEVEQRIGGLVTDLDQQPVTSATRPGESPGSVQLHAVQANRKWPRLIASAGSTSLHSLSRVSLR